MPQRLKRPRSAREPATNFERYSDLQDKPNGTEGKQQDEELQESMSLFMDFVQAAANQNEPKGTGKDKGTGNASNSGSGGVGQAGNAAPHASNAASKNANDALPPKKKASAGKAKAGSSARASVSVQRGTSSTSSKGSRPWTPAEEHDLMKLVDIYGNKRWSYIAQLINGRTGKQCRERWLNHLRPNIKKDEWSAEEERILAEGHAKLGTKWSSLAKLLPGRTENSIKNHWNATLRCKGRLRSSKGSSRGNKPGVLKEYMDSLQRGLTPEKAVEIACFAERLSTALAKETPTPAQEGNGPTGQNKRAYTQQEAMDASKKKEGASILQLNSLDGKANPKKPGSIDAVKYWNRRVGQVPHIDEWTFQYNELGGDWAWFWKLRNNRANVKIIERAFSFEKDMKWPHSDFNFPQPSVEDALFYTCVGRFDRGISTSQYDSRALQCILSACVFVVSRNEDVQVDVKIFFGIEQKKEDTLLIQIHSKKGIGKTTGLQEMLRQIKTVLTLIANTDSKETKILPKPVPASTSLTKPSASYRSGQKKTDMIVEVKKEPTMDAENKAGQPPKKMQKKVQNKNDEKNSKNDDSDSETISEAGPEAPPASAPAPPSNVAQEKLSALEHMIASIQKGRW